MSDLFDNAVYYGAEHDERLHFESPEEYVMDAFDGMVKSHSPEDIEEALSEIEIDVVAYQRVQVPSSQMKMWADSAAEHVAESFSCEYGDPDFGFGAGDDILPNLERAFHAATMRVLRDHATVWACKEVARRTYGEDEVRKLWEEEQP